MNSKNLIISFVAVSVAALIVSGFAVFAVARTYSNSLAYEKPDTPTDVPDETLSLPTVNNRPESDTKAAPESETSETTESENTQVSEESSDISTDSDEITSTAEFTLSLSGDRLTVKSPSGETIYERITDTSDFREHDRQILEAGISFPDEAAAMSAVYDLIS